MLFLAVLFEWRSSVRKVEERYRNKGMGEIIVEKIYNFSELDLYVILLNTHT